MTPNQGHPLTLPFDLSSLEPRLSLGWFFPMLSGADTNPSVGGLLMGLESAPRRHCECRGLALRVKGVQESSLGPTYASSHQYRGLVLEILNLLI